MQTLKAKHKRNKVLVVMLLPLLIFMAVIGWLACALDLSPKKTANKMQRDVKNVKKETGITFIPAVFEEENEIENQQKHNSNA